MQDPCALPTAAPSSRRRWLWAFCAYGFAVALSAGVVAQAMHVTRGSLFVPYLYSSDALLLQAWIQSMMDDGWYLHSSRLGMPFGSDIHDFPQADCLHYVALKALAHVLGDAAAAMNLYYLLTFPLATVSSLFVLRHFGVRYGPALLCSLLFTFLPFHFLRFLHLCLAAYYLVPLMVMVVLWVYLGQTSPGAASAWRLGWRRVLGAVLVTLLAASGGAYYACFYCFFLLATGTLSALYHRQVRPLGFAVLLLGCVGVGVLPDVLPMLRYWQEHGPNPEGLARGVLHAEFYGMKVVQMLLPVTHHRLPALAELKDEYNAHAPILNENDSATLGLIGGVGFLILMGRLFYRRRDGRRRVTDGLSFLCLCAVLLGTVGGFGALASMFGMGWIRGYNRISVFVGFFALFAVAVLLDRLARRAEGSRKGRVAFGGLLAGLAAVGLFDQIPSGIVPKYADLKAHYDHDREFIQRVEASLPAGTMVLQFPMRIYPQDPAEIICGYQRYDLLHAFVHSHSLRWSYGAYQGRPGDVWQQSLAAKPLSELLELASGAGFGAVYVDRAAYKDHGAALERELAQHLGAEPMVSGDHRLAVYTMTEFNEGLGRTYTPEERARRQAALNSMLVKWVGSFSSLEEHGATSWRWCGNKGELHLFNPLSAPREVKLTMNLGTNPGADCQLRIDSSLFRDELRLSNSRTAYTRTVLVPPGKHVIHFTCNGQRLVVPDDNRFLVFRVLDFRLNNAEPVVLHGRQLTCGDWPWQE